MPVNDSYAHTQYMYIDINISELLKLSEYASSLSGETPGGDLHNIHNAFAIEDLVAILKPRIRDTPQDGDTDHWADRYESVNTSMSLPLSDLEMTIMNSDITTDYAVIDSEYNFYSQDYENLLVSGTLVDTGASTDSYANVQEKMLPNFVLDLVKSAAGASARAHIRQFNALSSDKSIQRQAIGSSLYWNGSRGNPDTADYNYGGYPQRLAAVLRGNKVSDRRNNETLTSKHAKILFNRMENIIIDHDHVNLMQDIENKRENFPFYADLQFSPDKNSTLADAIIESKLMDEFMVYIADNVAKFNSTRPGDISEDPYYEATSKWDFQITENQSGVEYSGERLTATETRRKSFWISEFLNHLAEDDTSVSTPHFSTSPANSGTSCDTLKNKLYSIVLKGKVEKLVEDTGPPSMKKVFSPELSHSDTVAYRIAKYNEAGTQLIQNIYIPNSTSTDMMRYIDTQVKYGKMYTYRIFAYQALHATKYSYNDIIEYSPEDTTGTLTKGLLVTAHFTHGIKIVEVPIYSQQVRILDSGPLSPEVQIIPLKDSPDTIHIMLNNRIGREELDPITLVSGSDTDIFTTQAQAQRLRPGDKLTFESEDRPSKFQIFRTETRPTEWSDFGDNLHLELDTAVSSVYDITTVDKSFGTNSYAHAAAVRDNIEANTKYYYTFRTVDVHGFISNPTEIYQVELVNNDGTTYLLIEAVDFALKVPKQSTRHFRRYLKIAPKITQVMVDTEEYDSAWDAKSNGMNLGIQDVPVWGKEFKIIIRSKKTGREAHLYTTFNQTHNKTTTELGDPTVEDSST
ncbi:MAG TPA: hypothetical protein EYN67_18800 [Flavobacteriales bacterium]|nr:hypothetical protein [Flavobacteriales bacterium]